MPNSTTLFKALKTQKWAILWTVVTLVLCNIHLPEKEGDGFFFTGFDKMAHLGFFYILSVLLFYGKINYQHSFGFRTLTIFKIILIFIWLFASCSGSLDYQEKVILASNNVALDSTKVFLEMSISTLHEDDYVFKEHVYNNRSISPQYGGGFPRILSVNGKEVVQRMYIPVGKNCDTTVVDTISYLFFKVPKIDTSWVSFNIEPSQCNNLQLPNRFHFINKLSLTKSDIVLEQQAIDNDTYKNIYFFDRKS